MPAPFAVRRLGPLPSLSHGEAAADTGVPAERDFGEHVDQTNYSVVVSDRVVVKWLTPPAPLPHPAPDVLAHLAASGFQEMAPPYAALTLREKSGADGASGEREVLLALVTGYLPEARDGWEWCVDEAETGRTSFARDLGRLTADLHLALSTFRPPTAAPGTAAGPSSAAPGTAAGPPAPSPGYGTRAEHALREALALTGGEDGAWLATREAALRRELEPLHRPLGPTPLIRIHGDLHVGQLLRWRDGYAVIDFDGNPTVTGAEPYQPAARDVAQLATSLEHVAQVAVKRRGTPPEHAARWAGETRAAMLSAYRRRLAERGRPELLDEALLRPFEVEQECRELVYAARHLPRWRYAPMGVLRTWYP
ncbi:aminoglycoside phosphotransferase [Nonomuraea rhodomycinica]|uniref:Glucosamine kinase n=1 Tax=Nonomuraea rhodomycinica TaxID=1712872 RepID=A0A7Y6MHF4_9ACTN|nr:aminoglycoside phosphotransferase [Nonomuraea rhodomycinica]NUW46924.1 aminoglycoside phosphotransferase [Nonomuraea rhodomycinica]